MSSKVSHSMAYGRPRPAHRDVPAGQPRIPVRTDVDALLRKLLVEAAGAGLTHVEAWQALRVHGISRRVLHRAWARAIVSGELRCAEAGPTEFGGRWAVSSA